MFQVSIIDAVEADGLLAWIEEFEASDISGDTFLGSLESCIRHRHARSRLLPAGELFGTFADLHSVEPSNRQSHRGVRGLHHDAQHAPGAIDFPKLALDPLDGVPGLD